MQVGTLFGVGVGPGDPELITLKAIQTLRRVNVVFAAASTKNDHSLAEQIIRPHLREDIPVIRLKFPMTRDSGTLIPAWHLNAEKIIEFLDKGRDAALITLGDPMTYSTFGYIMRTIRTQAPHIPIRIVPGVTSYQAASAAVGWVLAEGEETLTVISGALGPDRLRKVIDHTDNLVMLKVYRNYEQIRDALDDLDLTSHSVLVTQCGLEGENVIRNLEEFSGSIPPYLSLLIIKKKCLK